MEVKLSASLEDYLETIYELVQEKQAARSRDIAERLKVHRSSVTGALRALADRGLINYAPYDLITLTAAGEKMAADICRRHAALEDFFVKVLAVPEADAQEAACQLEHALPPLIRDRLCKFIEFLQVCPQRISGWRSRFLHFCSNHELAADCQNCLLHPSDTKMEEKE